MRSALYAGTFDPVTKGHVDVARRAACLFDQVVIGVVARPAKGVLFSTEERVDLVRKAIGDIQNIRAQSYSCLTVEFARRIGARFIVRGLRMGSDFEREFDMALMNHKMAPDIDTICLMSSAEYQFVNSGLVKQAAQWGADVGVFVPEHSAAAMVKKFAVDSGG